MIKMITLYIRRFLRLENPPLQEDIARFLTSRSHFSIDKKIVKPGAFMPMTNSSTGVLETSVFQVSEIMDEEIWAIGKKNVVNEASGRTLYGRGDLHSKSVLEIGLVVEPDHNPPRHANIRGWPEKPSEQKLFALKLASSTRLCLISDEQI